MTEKQLAELPEQLDTSKVETAFASPLPQEREIDVTFFSHKYRRSTQLIGNQNGEAIKGRREWLEYDLPEPIYITSIKVAASGYDDHHEMELSFIDSLTENRTIVRAKFDGSGFSFQPKTFVRGFGLRPDLSWSWSKSQYISRVDVRGLEQKSFFEVVSIYENVTREKAKIESSLAEYLVRARKSNEQINLNDSKLVEQQEDIEKNEEEIENLSSQVIDLTAQRDEIAKRIESGISNEKERNERVKAIELDIRNLNANRETVSDQIAISQSNLKELKDEINLFPTEIAGYVSQGTNNIRLYFWISIIPALLIVFVTYRLFLNAERLINFDVTGSMYDVVKFLISRSPYVIVSATVLGICYSVLKALVSEIVNINRKRQELFKISIIARDVSYASQHGLALEAEQAYELRTQTKMELLKEHLKVNIGDEFTYSPNRAFLDRLKSIPPRKLEKVEDEQDQP